MGFRDALAGVGLTWDRRVLSATAGAALVAIATGVLLYLGGVETGWGRPTAVAHRWSSQVLLSCVAAHVAIIWRSRRVGGPYAGPYGSGVLLLLVLALEQGSGIALIAHDYADLLGEAVLGLNGRGSGVDVLHAALLPLVGLALLAWHLAARPDGSAQPRILFARSPGFAPWAILGAVTGGALAWMVEVGAGLPGLGRLWPFGPLVWLLRGVDAPGLGPWLTLVLAGCVAIQPWLVGRAIPRRLTQGAVVAYAAASLLTFGEGIGR